MDSLAQQLGNKLWCKEVLYNVFSEFYRGVLQLPCCPSKQGELSENILQNQCNKLAPRTVEKVFLALSAAPGNFQLWFNLFEEHELMKIFPQRRRSTSATADGATTLNGGGVESGGKQVSKVATDPKIAARRYDSDTVSFIVFVFPMQ